MMLEVKDTSEPFYSKDMSDPYISLTPIGTQVDESRWETGRETYG